MGIQLSITSLLHRHEAEPAITQFNRAGFVRVQVVTGQHQAPAVVLLIRAVKQSHHSHELSVFIHGHIERHAALGITSSDFDASTSSLSIVSALRSSVW